MNPLRTPATPQKRRLDPSCQVSQHARDGLHPLTAEDYPLVEIVADPTLGGHWLYLHPTPDGAESPPRFHPEGVPLGKACAQLISSYLIRSTPPVAQPDPSRHPYVYTAYQFITR